MQIIVLIGPPCSGKSTVGKHIESDYSGFKYISSGDIARRMADRHEGGYTADSINSGNMAPEQEMRNEILNAIKRCRMEGKQCVLDGFPRTIPQYSWLREVTAISDRVIFAQVHMEYADIEELCQKRDRSDMGSIRKRYNYYQHYTQPIPMRASSDGYKVIHIYNSQYNIKEMLKCVYNMMYDILTHKIGDAAFILPKGGSNEGSEA